MKSLKVLLLLIGVISDTIAQDSSISTKKIGLGDTLPEIRTNIQFYNKPTFSLTELRGKYVIFDLWNVHCKSCISAMPRLEQLQKKYSDKLEIIKVTRDGKEKLEWLYKVSKIAKECKLPSIINDTVISRITNEQYVPCFLFIDKNSVLRCITNSFSDKDLEDFVNDRSMNINGYTKGAVMMSYKNPFIIEWYPHLKNNFEGESYLAKVDKGYRTAGTQRFRRDKSGNIKEVEYSASLFNDLYMAAYGWHDRNFSRSRILFEADNAASLIKNSAGEPQIYVYELRLKNAVSEKIFYKYMQLQLDLYFNVSSLIEHRKSPCYVLKRIGDIDIQSKDSFAYADDYISEKRYIRKYVPWQFISTFMKQCLPYELIDETGINPKQRVDIEFYITPENLSKMNKQLTNYGLFIEKTEREMDVLVIKNIGS